MDKIGRFANAYTLIIICFCVDWMNGKHIFYSFAAKILPAVVHAVIQQYGRDLGKVYRADKKVPLTEIIDFSRMVLFISDRFCKNLVGTLVFTVIVAVSDKRWIRQKTAVVGRVYWNSNICFPAMQDSIPVRELPN